ncbi:ANTAR domain-containing response regulator [Cohnella yongneupensis]|uniref:ANTAR domain-containing response regulator n=1 Tax=Cohnella yongneupensis TaxID=425006 RepID=A0ABW0QTL6_9BACL
MNGTVVIADDDPIIRMDIREMLEAEGYQVAGEAKNGEEAVELAARLKPDLIIMDMKMPIMNGIKATRLIQRLQDTAVLLLTAYSQKDMVQEAREAGVTAFLVKPITERNLLPAVEIALGQKARLYGLKQEIDRLKQTAKERKTIEKAKGILMASLQLNEEDAYRTLRDVSMESRLPMNKLAEQIAEGGAERLAGFARGG